MSYYNPTDLSSALDLVAHTPGQIIAGGTDVYPAKQQGEEPPFFLDVTRISGFSDITQDAGSVRIGAATTWSQIAHADLPPAFDALQQAAREVGSIQIQNAGTIAGNICNASPAADGVPPLLALGAQVELASQARGLRVLPLEKFIQGVRRTDLASDELVVAIIIPPGPEKARSAFEKLGSRRYLVISISMVAAVVSCDDEGRIASAKIAVGSCSPVAIRLTALERDLIGKHLSEVVVSEEHLASLSPISDVRGSGAYRIDVVAAQIMRAIRRTIV